MFQYTQKWEDQLVYPADTMYEIDQVKLVKWLKHLRDLNHLLMNDLMRHGRERENARGAFNAYDCLLGDIRRGTIFMKEGRAMSTPTPTPTPRTDYAWAQTFDANTFLSGRGNAANQMRDECATLERELTALTAERDRNVSHRLEREKAEAERTDAIYQRVCEVERELRAENATLRAAQKACEACDEPTAFEVRQLRAELATEREKVRVLREALENLRDEQNGAPLYTREEEWKQAMDKADAALAATEGAK